MVDTTDSAEEYAKLLDAAAAAAMRAPEKPLKLTMQSTVQSLKAGYSEHQYGNCSNLSRRKRHCSSDADDVAAPTSLLQRIIRAAVDHGTRAHTRSL